MHRYLKIAILNWIIAGIGIWLIGCAGLTPSCGERAVADAIAYQRLTGLLSGVMVGNSGHQGLNKGYYSGEIRHAQAYCIETGEYIYRLGNSLQAHEKPESFQPGETYTIEQYLRRLEVIP